MFYRVKARSMVKLGPGIIKSSNLSYEKTLTVDGFLRAMLQEYESTTHVFPFGKSVLFAFEKMMHTDDADEPDMNIGYEINNFYAGFVKLVGQKVLVDKDVL